MGIAVRRDRCHHEDRPVRARAEGLRNEVVGLAGRGVGGEVAVVGEPESQSEHRQREEDEQAGSHGDEQHGAGLDQSAPTVGERGPQRRRAAERHLPAEERNEGAGHEAGHSDDETTDDERGNREAEAEEAHRYTGSGHKPPPAGALDAVVGETHQRRDERDRGEQRHGDGRGGSEAEAGDELQADERHAEEGQDHRDPGEHDGAPGGMEGSGNGVGRLLAGRREFPVAGDDEQGVVDADTEADHDPHERRRLGDGRDVAQEGHGTDPTGSHAGKGDPDGQSHGEDRAEPHDEDHDGEGESDEFGLRG